MSQTPEGHIYISRQKMPSMWACSHISSVVPCYIDITRSTANVFILSPLRSVNVVGFKRDLHSVRYCANCHFTTRCPCGLQPWHAHFLCSEILRGPTNSRHRRRLAIMPYTGNSVIRPWEIQTKPITYCVSSK